MHVQEPTSVDECVYFTNRSTNKAKAKAWVFRGTCQQCKKGVMGKPRDAKTGKPSIRATMYVCPECHFTQEKQAYEDTLTLNVKYTCHVCKHTGEVQVPFKMKTLQLFDEEEQKKISVKAVRFQCQKCGVNIDITKKMK